MTIDNENQNQDQAQDRDQNQDQDHIVGTQDIASKLESADKAQHAGNYPEAERLAREVLHAADLSNRADRLHQASALLVLGSCSRLQGDYAAALDHLNDALQTSEELVDKENMAKALGNIGIVHWNLSDYTKALEYYGKALELDEELGNKAGVAWDLGGIGTVHWNLSDYTKALEYYSKALELNEEVGNKEGVASNLGNIGNVHRILSDYTKALEYFDKDMELYEELGNKAGVARNLGNIGLVHRNLSDYAKALEYHSKALEFNEELGNKEGVARNLGNIGNVHWELSDFSKALEYHGKALELNAELGNKAGVAINLGNIGNVHRDLSDFDKALEYCGRALQLMEDSSQESEAANVRGNIGALYAIPEWSGRDDAKAEEYLLASIAVSEELGAKNYDAHKTLAELYKQQQRWQECQEQYQRYYELKDKVQSEEAKKSAVLMEQRKQIAEREKEIAIAKAAADARMSATTKLLYKVLPQSVATRMIDGEEEIADYFPTVSILFADIAGFTPISADMPAIVVVRFLNFVFAQFDAIIKRHGCEKIKTIGDGYMAVSGAPIECADHAERLAAAALEMQETITLPESIREHMPGGINIGVRIGLHTGSVVAGVIGEERFVYDVYSDAVNTAARMESHGEKNKIHVSSDFYRHLQNRFAMTKNAPQSFVFEKRGEMEIKGKGMMRTYFLEKA